LTPFGSESFDSEAVILLRSAVDRAWRTLPHQRQTARNKNLIADAIVHSAVEGERDPVLLSILRSRRSAPGHAMERYDFEVQRGDDTFAIERCVELGPKSMWFRITELASNPMRQAAESASPTNLARY
jgi:hypothetical protein